VEWPGKSNVRAARWDGEQWLTELVYDPFGTNNTGRPALATDAEGELHAMFFAPIVNNTHMRVHHARRVNGAWDVVEIANTTFNPQYHEIMQLAVDPAGNVYSIVPSDNNYNTGIVARWNGVENRHMQLSLDGFRAATGDLSVDGDGKIRAIGFKYQDGNDLGFLVYDDVDTTIQQLIPMGCCGYPTQGKGVVSPDLEIYMAGSTNILKTLVYSVSSAGVTEVFEVLDSDFILSDQTMAVDDDGTVAILFSENTGVGNPRPLSLVMGTPGAWETTLVDMVNGSLGDAIMRFDSGGTPQFCYKKPTFELWCTHPLTRP